MKLKDCDFSGVATDEFMGVPVGSVYVKRLRPSAILPKYMSDWASGMDLCADIPFDYELFPDDWMAIRTGVAIQVKYGYEGQIRPRSSIFLNHGVTCAFGTVDADYRGELKVVLHNLSRKVFAIKSGMRIAQLVVAKQNQVKIVEVDELDPTERGDNGFGSTGL